MDPMGYKQLLAKCYFKHFFQRFNTSQFPGFPGSSARNIGHDGIRQGGIGNRRIRSQRIEEGLPWYVVPRTFRYMAEKVNCAVQKKIGTSFAKVTYISQHVKLIFST